ncbi:60S ribosomal protein L9-like [Schistocerca gregaria]|uniref:60S ribosomal protein L9-like n=1 Tax=Schistocerca gregaria TaxID=7010 RepID=UPI00211E7FC5|nr:60S ribosomal protein L9-like [Schistocerca gregaria]
MKFIQSSRIVEIPDNVTATVSKRVVTIKGPRGTLTRSFRHIQVDIYEINKRRLKVEIWWGNKKHLSCIRTICTHIKNMIIGVTKGFVYKMRSVFAHFPIIVTILNENKETGHGNAVEIRNFLGQREIPKVKMLPGVTVCLSKDVKNEIALHGNDIEKVSQSAANIHGAVRVKNKDIRKFLDGIYVSQRILGDTVKDV